MIAHQTRAQQRIKWLMSRKRPLTEDEQEDLYKALHADYMRKWRQHNATRKLGNVENAKEKQRKLTALHWEMHKDFGPVDRRAA